MRIDIERMRKSCKLSYFINVYRVKAYIAGTPK